jgi:hypothetical protein
MSQINSISNSGGGGGTTVTGAGQTIGAVTADIIVLNLGSSSTTKILEVKVVGYEATTPLGVGYNLVATARTNGIAATIVAAQDKIVFEEGALLAGDCNFTTAGNTVKVTATGTAALTINWKAVLTYVGV